MTDEATARTRAIVAARRRELKARAKVDAARADQVRLLAEARDAGQSLAAIAAQVPRLDGRVGMRSRWGPDVLAKAGL